MDTFFPLFTLFAFFFAIGLRFLPIKESKKHLQKAIKKTKQAFLWIGIGGIIITWFFIEDVFLYARFYLWGTHITAFIGFLGYAVYFAINEKNRIESIEKRRKEKTR